MTDDDGDYEEILGYIAFTIKPEFGFAVILRCIFGIPPSHFPCSTAQVASLAVSAAARRHGNRFFLLLLDTNPLGLKHSLQVWAAN